jgi:hypothetical protein
MEQVNLPLTGHRPVLNDAMVLIGCTCGWPAPSRVPNSQTAFILHCLEALGANVAPEGI